MNGTTADDASHITEVVNEISTQSEIRSLASSTKELIEANDKQTETILPKIKNSVELIKTLVDSIYELNGRIVNIAATTEEISAQSDSIRVLSDEIKVTVSEI